MGDMTLSSVYMALGQGRQHAAESVAVGGGGSSGKYVSAVGE